MQTDLSYSTVKPGVSRCNYNFKELCLGICASGPAKAMTVFPKSRSIAESINMTYTLHKDLNHGTKKLVFTLLIYVITDAYFIVDSPCQTKQQVSREK